MLKKELAVAVVVLFIGVSVIPSVIGDNPGFGRTITVDDDGGADYTIIQDAIDAAEEGDTVFVYSGEYFENLVVCKSIELIGENRLSTIINGDDKGDTVKLCANGILITNFTIKNGTTSSRILDYSGIKTLSDYNIISNNVIIDNGVGIGNMHEKWVTSEYNVIVNNIISDNVHNIMLNSRGYNNISKNIISYCHPEGGSGIWITGHLFHRFPKYSNNNVISGNNIIHNCCGIDLLYCYNTSVYMNNFMLNYNGLFLPFSSFTITNNNNFIDNEIDASFRLQGINGLNNWDGNFWNSTDNDPTIIFGSFHVLSIDIPWLNFDWHPAKEPYDIP